MFAACLVGRVANRVCLGISLYDSKEECLLLIKTLAIPREAVWERSRNRRGNLR